MRFLLFATTLLLASPPLTFAVGPPRLARDRTVTIQKGLSFLTKEASGWKENRACASCHHAPMTIWALNEARKQGHAIDEKTLSALTTWVIARDDPAKVFPKQPPRPEIVVNETPLLLALGLEAGETSAEGVREGLRRMLSVVASGQGKDGSWRLLYEWEPIGSTPEVITAWSLLALSSPNAPFEGKEAIDARAKGLKWLHGVPPRDDSQALAVRLILWTRLDRPMTERRSLIEKLLRRQNADGGFSPTKDLTSNAYATGQAIYALGEAGMKSNTPEIQKAQAFLANTQQSDGSWAMTSRVGQPSGKRAKDLEPIAHAGTAWAVIGLVRTTPRGRSATK